MAKDCASSLGHERPRRKAAWILVAIAFFQAWLAVGLGATFIIARSSWVERTEAIMDRHQFHVQTAVIVASSKERERDLRRVAILAAGAASLCASVGTAWAMRGAGGKEKRLETAQGKPDG